MKTQTQTRNRKHKTILFPLLKVINNLSIQLIRQSFKKRAVIIAQILEIKVLQWDHCKVKDQILN
jgi:hypothetical protein